MIINLNARYLCIIRRVAYYSFGALEGAFAVAIIMVVGVMFFTVSTNYSWKEFIVVFYDSRFIKICCFGALVGLFNSFVFRNHE